MFLDAQLYSDAHYVGDAVLTIEELQAFMERELPPEESTGQRAAFEQILANRLVRAKRYAEARKYLSEDAQKWLDEYLEHLAEADKPGTSKEDRSDALWAAAQVMNEHGEELANYYDPTTMAQRKSGRIVTTGPNPVISLKYGKADKFVPPISAAEKERLKKHTQPELHRYYSTYLAADLAYRAASLLPDNDDRTANLLNTAGGWLKNGDEEAADRFYQAIERRCPQTELGKKAIKRHWFVPDEEQEEPPQ